MFSIASGTETPSAGLAHDLFAIPVCVALVGLGRHVGDRLQQ